MIPKMLVANLPCMILLIIAGIMATNGQAGWGWFLFAGLLCIHVLKGTDD